jgi:hypothetical protein
MSVGLRDIQSNIFTGLGTWTYTASVAGLYDVSAVASVLPPSGLSIVVNQNGSPVATSNAPASAQQSVSAQVLDLNVAVSDIITVVLTSSTQSDTLPNALKTLITLNQTI